MKINPLNWKLFHKNKDQQTSTDQQTTNAGNQNENNSPQTEDNNQVNDGKAHIYNLIIVDESGSMYPLEETTLSGINETIHTIRSAQKEFASTQKHTLSIVTFSSNPNMPDVDTKICNRPIAEVQEFHDYSPGGCTPLYDAMGVSLTTLHDQIKDDSNATAVVTVLTDGLENASHKWNASRLRQLIEQLKAEGWSFSYMGSVHNVKEVTDLLSIENVVEFSHDDFGAGNTWRRERSSRRAYYEKMNAMYGEEREISEEERMERKRRFAREYYSERVSPDRIDHLEDNEIFVFGSNAQGLHQGGAARHARHHFGAIMGQGEGLQGQSYAIPTMEGLTEMRHAIHRFAMFASEHPHLRFLVTRIGCGVAGYSVDQVAPLFKECIDLENVALTADFWKILGLRMY